MYTNFITYYIIVIPSAFFLCFSQGMGIKGLWFAFFIGLTHQIVAYLYIIHKLSDWDEIVAAAKKRQNENVEYEMQSETTVETIELG